MHTKVILGIVIIIFGVSMILNQVFKIDFPFFRLLVALVIIFFGFKLLFGSFGIHVSKDDKNSSVFSNRNVHPENVGKKEEYNTIFGSSVLDFSKADFKESESTIEINAIFGHTQVILPENASVSIKASSVFGAVRTPDGLNVVFSETKSEYGDKNAPVNLKINANAVFGNIEITQ
jgi:predicted membrane protein